MLITNYITSAWRNILRHKLFSIINILGLAIGLAAVMLIALYVRYETSYDTFWKNADNIYRVHRVLDVPGMARQNNAFSPSLIKEAFNKDFPQVQYSSRFNRNNAVIGYGDTHIQYEISLADPEITNIFDFNLISGTLDGVLNDGNTVIISKSTATQIFGGLDPLNKTLTIKFTPFTRDFRIGAVIEDIPHNSMLNVNIIVPFVESEWQNSWYFSAGWNSAGGPFYFTVNEETKIEDLKAQLPTFIDRNYMGFNNFKDLKTSDIVSFETLNVQEVHLKAGADYELRPNGDKKNLIIFTIVSLLILFTASTNYMNLSTARASNRAKEVSLRKTVGASRLNLIYQFLGESILLTLFALIIAICFVEIALPIFNVWSGFLVKFNYISLECLSLMIVTISVGILGGIYPAFILSNYHPANVLKANHSGQNNSSTKLRTALVILQFSISICLFVSTAVVYSQINFAMNEDPGFEKDNLLVISAFGEETVREKGGMLLNELDRLPNVTNVTTSNFMPLPVSYETRAIYTEPNPNGSKVSIHNSYVGYDYFKTYKIDMLQGRTYDKLRDFNMPSYREIYDGKSNISSVILNEAAVRKFKLGNLKEAIGKSIYRFGKIEGESVYHQFDIIGVIPDVRIQNFKTEVRAEVFFLDTNRTDVISIRFNGDPSKTVDTINTVWQREFSNLPLEYEFAEERMFKEYLKEQNELSMFATFSGLAIFIACLGLFGLASFTAESRTKEIGIRKVFGAEVFQIVRMLVFQFSKPVLIANIIAWPIAYLAMSRWLESFVYRIDDMVIIALCLIAGLTALLIAWATVAGNSYAVARQNPIKALRYE